MEEFSKIRTDGRETEYYDRKWRLLFSIRLRPNAGYRSIVRMVFAITSALFTDSYFSEFENYWDDGSSDIIHLDDIWTVMKSHHTGLISYARDCMSKVSIWLQDAFGIDQD